MKRLDTRHLVTLASAALLSATACAGTLLVDGILIVQGMSMEGASVIVVGDSRDQPLILTNSLEHFTLVLELNSEYLVSFERPGCVSKQLRFDTGVPKGAAGQDWRFPFQVTLNPPPNGELFTYAGPVGQIKYDKRLEDFSYDTDYRVARDKKLEKQLELAQLSIRQADLQVVPPANLEKVLLRSNATEKEKEAPALADRPDTDAYSRTARMVPQTAPLVHVIASPEVRVPAHTERMESRVSTARIVNEPKKSDIAALILEPERVSPHQVEMRPDRSTEVLVDKLHVTTIVRYEALADALEYRRVASYYGGVTFFMNGQPCTEETYKWGVSR